MKEPASKHYSHLDPSEPIPQIEPRYNQRLLVAYEAASKVMVWMMLGLIGAHLLIYALVASFLVARIIGMAVSLVILGACALLVIRAQRRAGLKRHDAKKSKDDQWGIPVGLQMRYYMFFMLFMFVMQGGLDYRDGLLSGLFTLGIYVFFIGIALILVSRYVRQPGQINCERCDYPLTGLTLPTGCPECGHAIVDLSHATDRPRVRDARILVVGIVLVVLAGSIGVLRFVSPGAVYAPIPRATLLQLAPTDEHAFNQLMTTITSPEEERQLFEAMIAKRIGFDARGGYEQEDWVGSKIAQGWLTREELMALYTPATEVRIRAPKRARVGEPVSLLIEGGRVRLPRGAGLTYFFAGFFIDDDTTPLGRTDTPKYRTFLADPERETYLRNGYVPNSTWTPTEPGAYTIRARLVFAIAPGLRIQSQIDWSAQGDSRFPTPPLWTREVELEHTITVEP